MLLHAMALLCRTGRRISLASLIKSTLFLRSSLRSCAMPLLRFASLSKAPPLQIIAKHCGSIPLLGFARLRHSIAWLFHPFAGHYVSEQLPRSASTCISTASNLFAKPSPLRAFLRFSMQFHRISVFCITVATLNNSIQFLCGSSPIHASHFHCPALVFRSTPLRFETVPFRCLAHLGHAMPLLIRQFPPR